MRALLIVLALVAINFQSFSQAYTYEYVDNLSYQQFTNKEYQKLQDSGNSALKKQIDFYYLRMRLGVSYYEKGNYAISKIHFAKALEFYPIDTVAKEYLYFSYLFNGESDKAELLYKQKLPTSVQKRVSAYQSVSPKWAISFGAGYIGNSNIEINKSKNITDATNNFGEQNLQGTASFYEFKVENWVNQHWSWKAGMSYFNLNATGRFARPNTTTINAITNDYVNFDNKQVQFNGALSYISSKKWQFSGGIGLYNQNYSYLTSTLNGISQYVSTPISTNDWSYMGNFVVQKTFEKNIPFIGISYANWASTGSMIQLQPGFTRILLKNSRLYSTSILTYINQNSSSQLVLTQKLGGQITKPLWYETQISVGNHQNMIIDNGFITLNSADPIKFILGADLFYFYKRLTFNLGYKFQLREASYYNFSTNTYQSFNYNYSNHLLNTSITWKF